MTVAKRVEISCDIPWCKTVVRFDHQYAPAARGELTRSGWRHNGKKDFCPEHATLGTPNPGELRLVSGS